ncbi:Druantia anti-phage system protein DruA [Acidiferrobacter sp. SPIII_3]|uniref:Druantia anti-phage system protein DruA n=1 Tax=Acidiferrobacter sp. SPIII_3 TaxID=1281578 RepID=UPI003519F733
MQFSSPAWRLQGRNRWIGWDEPRGLQQIISHSHFLILPHVRVTNLAGHVLALALRQVTAGDRRLDRHLRRPAPAGRDLGRPRPL